MALPIVPDNANARQLGEALSEAADEIRRIRSLATEERTEDTAREARELRQFVVDIDTEHQARSAAERATYVPPSNGPVAGFDAPDNSRRSVGEMLVTHDDYTSFVGKAGSAGKTSRSIDLEDSLLTRTLLAENDSANSSLFIPTQDPIQIRPLQRKLFIRQLLAHANTTRDHVPYMQEKNIATNELFAGVTAQGAQKNEVKLEWEPKDAPIRKITAWIPLTTEIIEDAPTLRAYVDNRLLWMLALAEEIELLNGSGTAPHILGIRNQTGLQTQDAIVDDVPATIGLCIGKVENVDGEADGVAMNPLDYWEQVVSRHTAQFDNSGSGNAPAGVGNISWGLPVARTRTLERGVGLAAGWFQGGTVIDRQQANIEVGNQHLDYFTTNKVAVKAEERIGLAVDRPSFFVEFDVEFTDVA